MQGIEAFETTDELYHMEYATAHLHVLLETECTVEGTGFVEAERRDRHASRSCT